MTQWAKAAKRVQENKKAKEKMVASKAEEESEYGARMAIMADLGGPTKLSGRAHKEASRIQRSTSSDIPGTPQAKEEQAGWARQGTRLQERTGWEKLDMQLLEANRDSCWLGAARSLQPSRRRLPCQLPTERSRSLRRIG